MKKYIKQITLGVVLLIMQTLTNVYAVDSAKQYRQDKKQIDCLSTMVYHESRAESLKGQVAVVFVALNRIKDSRFPKTPCSVIHQRGQYSWVGKGYKIKEPELYEQSRQVVMDVLNGKHQDYSRGSLFFNSNHKKPTPTAKCTVRIGGHSFYKDVKK